METDQKHKSHQKPHSGRKADKKSNKKEQQQLSKGEIKERKRNPKAFAIQNAVKAERQFRHKQDKLEKKYHIPQIDRTPVEPPPVVVSVIGPAKVGKSTLIRNLVHHFSGKKINEIRGPITVVAGKNKRFTFIECNNDINNMIDLAKISDISLLLIDASFGFEMETFEYLNICKAHGEHRVMGVLTHLDQFNKYSKMKKAKKDLKRRFWTEVYAGAKLFYLSRIAAGNEYVRTEIKNLARFLTVYRLQPVQFRELHPYMLVDRFEDLTNAEDVKRNETINRNVVLYGYSRGSFFKPNQMIHIAGCGDMAIDNISFIPDPCQLPEQTTSKRKLLSQKEKLVYSPFSGIGGILYDKDAIYIDLGTSHFHRDNQTSKVFDKLSKNDKTIDEKIAESDFKMFSNGNNDENDDDDDIQENESQNDNSEGEEEDLDEDQLNNLYNSDSELSELDNNDVEMNNLEDEDEDNNDKYSFDDDSDDDDEQNERSNENKWRDNIAKKASDTFYKYLDNTESIQKLVYGDKFELKDDGELDQDNSLNSNNVFNVNESLYTLNLNGIDSTKFNLKQNRNWEDENVLESIKDCFVTGKWTEDENAEILLRENEEEMEEYGDFEDLEMNENDNNEDESSNDDDGSEDEEANKRRMELKRKLKEEFNTNYDDKSNNVGGNKNNQDDEDENDEGPEEAKFYREIKKKLEKQAQINKSEFEGLSDELRVQYEGFRPGMYIRIQIKNMPSEFVRNFDPQYPIIVGGLLSGETNIGFLQVRIKKHRWYPKILKTKNPLIISLGWRRFQTLPIYSMQDHNGRDRCLKYTPQHLHCYASFYGPITPQGTGFVAIQDCADITNRFRLAATGTVLNLDKSLNLVKKLKIVGHPMKIYKKTAFIQGMFNSSLEACKFEGALVKTVSGIRGHIKKALSKPEGAFRAAFEDKILLSDIVFMRTWYAVKIPEFYYPVCNLLLSNELKMKWKGMKTVGELRHERGITVDQNKDSFYKIMERKKFNFKPLVLPKGLEKDLPFKSKLKHQVKKENKLNRVAVIREPKEQKIVDLQKRIRAMYKESVKLDKKHALVKKDKNRAVVQAKLKKREESIKKRKKAFCKKNSLFGTKKK